MTKDNRGAEIAELIDLVGTSLYCNDPIVRASIDRFRAGGMTRDECLSTMIRALADHNKDLIKKVVDFERMRLPRPVKTKDGMTFLFIPDETRAAMESRRQ